MKLDDYVFAQTTALLKAPKPLFERASAIMSSQADSSEAATLARYFEWLKECRAGTPEIQVIDAGAGKPPVLYIKSAKGTVNTYVIDDPGKGRHFKTVQGVAKPATFLRFDEVQNEFLGALKKGSHEACKLAAYVIENRDHKFENLDEEDADDAAKLLRNKSFSVEAQKAFHAELTAGLEFKSYGWQENKLRAITAYAIADVFGGPGSEAFAAPLKRYFVTLLNA